MKPTDEKKPAPPMSFDSIPVERMFFMDPLDFVGDQQSSVGCTPELARAGRSYMARYIPALGCFELTCGLNGAITTVRMIPLERIKQWIRA